MTNKTDVALVIVNKLKALVTGGDGKARIYRNTFPQLPALPVWPSIRYTFVSTSPNLDICGDGGPETADYRVQIDVVDLESKGPTAFATLGDSVRTAMRDLLPLYVWEGEFDDFDAETKTNRLSLDYVVYLSTP
ncbi:DUF3168 domain-containing protein [Variovorax sp. PAMC 28711]|uniref:DUF3168 domain-containing protein n=1 Tax=Variovorax sp. PAMC 28711 TaxID=1795631 RepID=UPI00078B2A37|nr:DUF3168 domain-containing protein [Variovorax sp. PAMC 28711]AMM23166.1 hypothetical protein AX767_01345 [Variovorax sp. PAMC 28711]